jgi:hypothetical protein
MESNSIETLLLRHFGNTAPSPAGLEKRLYASVHQQAEEARKAQLAAARLQQQRISRRHVVRLAIKGAGETGMGLLCLGLEGLELFETALVNQDTVVIRRGGGG